MTEENKTATDSRPDFDNLPLEVQAMRLRMELTGMQNRFDEMNALGASIMADREASKALSILREIASNIENYETISHITMFDKVGIKAAMKDQDWDCVEEHKKSLLKGTELMGKAQEKAARAQADLVEHLKACTVFKVENPQDLAGVEKAAKDALFENNEARLEANRTLGAFQEEYNGKVTQFQAVATQLKAQQPTAAE